MQKLLALPKEHLLAAKTRIQNELGTSAQTSLSVYLKTGITELLEDNENNNQEETPRRDEKLHATLASRSASLNK
jgi:hypothetical protein